MVAGTGSSKQKRIGGGSGQNHCLADFRLATKSAENRVSGFQWRHFYVSVNLLPQNFWPPEIPILGLGG